VPRRKKLPTEVIKDWPDVLNDVDVNVVPVEYLHSIRVIFNDGRIWDLDIEKSRQKTKKVNIEKELHSLFQEYENAISNIDFRLNTDRLKADIKKRTNLFMKKRR
jgi:hypothetical protein|tara:strand:- start:10870 stop:11184 length:315 start_codon:yes stop_codon:yes gene_type:complete